MIEVTTGTSYTLSSGSLTGQPVCIVWSSATAGAKTTNIPASAAGNNGQQVTIKVTQGDGSAHTIAPASGTIEGVSSYGFTDVPATVHVALTLLSDGTNTNWLVS